MERSTNALAELAVRLGTDALSLGADKYPEIAKAQRIVAELANVKSDRDGCPTSFQSIDAVKNCRAIAEKGAGDGK